MYRTKTRKKEYIIKTLWNITFFYFRFTPAFLWIIFLPSACYIRGRNEGRKEGRKPAFIHFHSSLAVVRVSKSRRKKER
uniref:Uncharacterized protein n=1 Tax=Anguilla anguilla TaxID=7936 RepID=A0A0E9S2F6_ANGAN